MFWWSMISNTGSGNSFNTKESIFSIKNQVDPHIHKLRDLHTQIRQHLVLEIRMSVG